MGQQVTRPRPYNSRSDTQDIDITYTDERGSLTLVEVKDSVMTLEKKMNINAGGEYEPSPDAVAVPDQGPSPVRSPSKDPAHYDPAQLASLVATRESESIRRESESAPRGPVNLRVICVRPKGWVRFILSSHCETLSRNNVVLQIGDVEFSPAELRAFRHYLERKMDDEKPGWRMHQREGRGASAHPKDAQTPIDPTVPASRDAAMWEYEKAHDWGTHGFTS